MKWTFQNCFQHLRHMPGLPALMGLGICAVATLTVWRAERIQVFYGLFELTIPIEELEAISITGAPASTDRILASRLTDEQMVTLQTFLNTQLDIDVITMSRLSHSEVGENLLDRFGQIVRTGAGLNGAKAIRSALIAAAADGDGLSAIEVIRHFPLDTIQLDLPLIQQIVAENQQIFQRQIEVVANIQQQANITAGETLLDGSLSQAGEYFWRIETLTFINPNRPAPSVADLYWPNRLSSNPVIVISHGVASNRQTLAYLAKHLASHGYAVVVLDHADTNTEKFNQFLIGLEGAPDPNSLVHRSRDISAVLDTLERRAENDPALRSLDLQSVGVLGHSLGGSTVLAAAGANLQRDQLTEVCHGSVSEQPLLNLSMLLQCRLIDLPDETPLTVGDDRVKAVMAINPLTSHIFGPTGMGALEVPALFVASTDDYFVPALPEQIEPFQWISGEDKYLVVIENGTHFTSLNADEQVFPIPEFLIGPEPALAQPLLRSLTTAFFDSYLRDLPDSNTYLNQAYLDRFESSFFQFSIVKGHMNWLD